MNKKNIVIVSLLLSVLAMGRGFGQQRPCDGLPDLSEEQKEQMKTLRTELHQTVLPLKSKLEILQAELKELMVADSPNEKAIDKKIDAISDVMKQMRKSRVMNQLKMRKLLTPEQRVHFDMEAMNRPGHGFHHGGSMHRDDMMRGKMKSPGMGHRECRCNQEKPVEVIEPDIEE